MESVSPTFTFQGTANTQNRCASVVVAGERTALCKCNSAEEGAAVLFLRDLVLKQRELKFHLASFSEAGFDFNAISDTDQ